MKKNTITSNKLYNVKKKSLKDSLSKTGVSSENELLLLTSPNESDEIFRKLNIKSHRDVIKEETKEYNEIKVISDIFKGHEVYSGNQIKEIANKYFLTIRPIGQLTGYFSDETVKFLKEFTDEFKEADLIDSRFFVLTGRENFTSIKNNKLVETFIIFYREGRSDSYNKAKNTDLFTQITSSGEDFNEYRRLIKYVDGRNYNGSIPTLFFNLIWLTLFLILFIGSLILNLYALAIFNGLLSGYIWYNKNNKLPSDKYWNKAY